MTQATIRAITEQQHEVIFKIEYQGEVYRVEISRVQDERGIHSGRVYHRIAKNGAWTYRALPQSKNARYIVRQTIDAITH